MEKTENKKNFLIIGLILISILIIALVYKPKQNEDTSSNEMFD